MGDLTELLEKSPLSRKLKERENFIRRRPFSIKNKKEFLRKIKEYEPYEIRFVGSVMKIEEMNKLNSKLIVAYKEVFKLHGLSWKKYFKNISIFIGDAHYSLSVDKLVDLNKSMEEKLNSYGNLKKSDPNEQKLFEAVAGKIIAIREKSRYKKIELYKLFADTNNTLKLINTSEIKQPGFTKTKLYDRWRTYKKRRPHPLLKKIE